MDEKDDGLVSKRSIISEILKFLKSYMKRTNLVIYKYNCQFSFILFTAFSIVVLLYDIHYISL